MPKSWPIASIKANNLEVVFPDAKTAVWAYTKTLLRRDGQWRGFKLCITPCLQHIALSRVNGIPLACSTGLAPQPWVYLGGCGLAGSKFQTAPKCIFTVKILICGKIGPSPMQTPSLNPHVEVFKSYALAQLNR